MIFIGKRIGEKIVVLENSALSKGFGNNYPNQTGGVKHILIAKMHLCAKNQKKNTVRELILAGTNFRGRKRNSRELNFAVLPYFRLISFIFLGVFQNF